LNSGANKNLYGKELSAEQIILKGVARPPAAAKTLISLLNKKSPKNRSDAK
jgi:lipid-binding SYLF domain-containing protein